MHTNIISENVFIVTENANGEMYSIHATDEEILDDWYGDCDFVPENDAPVHFMSWDDEVVALRPGMTFEEVIKEVFA